MALTQLAAMQVGEAVTPFSYAYSVRSEDGALVHHILNTTGAEVLIVDDDAVHREKLGGWRGRIFAFENAGPQAAPWDSLLRGEGELSAKGRQLFAAVDSNTLAKVQFTSGSTSLPKGVQVTHGMMASNVTGLAQTWPFLGPDEVLVDWLPWNHTFGGNLIVNLVLKLGGTLHIDDGSPTPAGLERTASNIASVRPTVYFGVPRSYTQLLTRMQADDDLKCAFFERLKFVFVAAAALDQATYDAIRALGREVRGADIPFLSAWGCTETAPNATHVYWPTTDIRVIGLPAPGVTVKLAPDASGKRELRVRGPNVTPGYVNNPEATRSAFDEEGFYRTGDAGVLAADPQHGLRFDGRLSEDFKLTSGVWVHNAGLRASINALGQPYLHDVVIAAPNRPYLTALIFPNLPVLRERFPDVDPDSLLVHPAVIALFRDVLARHNAGKSGSSRCLVRFTLLDEMPRLDHGEATDKGYINQRAVLENYAGRVDALYAADPPAGVFSEQPRAQ
ncbi:MAG: AMP-binding protein [Anaerolineae bacterium]